MQLPVVSIMTLAVTSAFAQDPQIDTAVNHQSPCSAYVESRVDSLHGTYTTTSKKDILISKDGKETLSIVFLTVDRSIVLSIRAVHGVYCVDEDNKVLITFRDGTSLELPHDGRYNCDGEFSLFFFGPFGKKREYTQLITKEIDKVKIGLRKSTIDKSRPNFIEVSVPVEASRQIMAVAECLVE